MSAPLSPATRPTPLRDAFKTVGGGVSFVGGVVTMLAGWGVLSLVQADAAQALLGAIPGLITLVTGLVASFGTAKVAEKDVTPTADPAMIVDGELVRAELVPAASFGS